MTCSLRFLSPIFATAQPLWAIELVPTALRALIYVDCRCPSRVVYTWTGLDLSLVNRTDPGTQRPQLQLRGTSLLVATFIYIRFHTFQRSGNAPLRRTRRSLKIRLDLLYSTTHNGIVGQAGSTVECHSVSQAIHGASFDNRQLVQTILRKKL
jgi:hypothetical protein